MTLDDLRTETATQQRLQALRDVEGLLGSFVVDASGELVAKDLPAVFDRTLFAEVGPRLMRLEETLADGDDRPEMVVLRYSEFKLHLRFLKQGVLGVVSGVDVNLATLKMALTLTARRVEAELQGAGGDDHVYGHHPASGLGEHARGLRPSGGPLDDQSGGRRSLGGLADGAATPSQARATAPVAPPLAPSATATPFAAPASSQPRRPLTYRGRRV